MSGNSPKTLQFDRFSLDLARGTLRSNGEDIAIRPKCFDVLCFLANNPGRLLSKRELDEAVWPNVAVTDASLVQCIRHLREKLGDEQHTLIRTMNRRGYLFDTVVTEVDGTANGRAADAATPVQGPPALDVEQAVVPHDPPRPLPSVPAIAAGPAVKHGSKWIWLLPAVAAIFIILAGGVYALWDPAARKSGRQASDSFAVFKDCDRCPEMIVLPAGDFSVAFAARDSQSVVRATIPRPVAVGRFEVTVEQFAAFVEQTHYDMGSTCGVVTGSGRSVKLHDEMEATFRQQPNMNVTERHPAACVSWYDAKAYVAWLAATTGKPYRLPSNAEWEYAARAGTSGPYSFGGGVVQLCEYARFADLGSPFVHAAACHGTQAERGPIPVGQLKPNPWGLFDVHGNLWEWTDECASNDPSLLNAGNSRVLPGDTCQLATYRGGGWVTSGNRLDVGFRLDTQTRTRSQNIGFRVVLTME